MDKARLLDMAKAVLEAWNSQDPERVVSCYTHDLVYRDPNTRGEVRGEEAMRRYLSKLFGAWQMHWSVREVFPLQERDGGAFLWRASFRKPNGENTAEADGMDLVILSGGRIARNEVYFDRAVLAPLL